MNKLPIVLSRSDYDELGCMVAAAGKLSERCDAEVAALQQELARAPIVTPDQVPKAWGTTAPQTPPLKRTA